MIRAVVFDFDGVLVESVDVKTQAFAALFAEHGEQIVRQVVAYHLANGGISRVQKFKHYYERFLGQPLSTETLQHLCERFRELVLDQVLRADFVSGVPAVLESIHRSGHLMFIASGTPEEELRHIVEKRGLAGLFHGVYGSPVCKPELLRKIESSNGLHSREMVFIGDSLTDFAAAQAANTHFIARLSPGSTVDWNLYSVPVVANLEELQEILSGQGASRQIP